MLAGTRVRAAVVGVVAAWGALEEPPPQPAKASARPTPTTAIAAQVETVLRIGDN
jgi:hypothetical protein